MNQDAFLRSETSVASHLWLRFKIVSRRADRRLIDRSPTKQSVNMPLLARPRPSQTGVTQPITGHVQPSTKPISRRTSNIDLTFTLRNGNPLIRHLLTTAFGKESFRGCQREVIEAALESISTRIIL